MRKLLSSGTDSAMRWLYDPAAIPGAVGNPVTDGRWQTWAEEGRLLAHCTAANGEVRIELAVDEDVDSLPTDPKKRLVESALLRVPSGEIRFSGAEDACPGISKDATELSPPDAIRVEPGNYLADVYRVPLASLSHRLAEAGGTIDEADWQRFNQVNAQGCTVLLVLPVLSAVAVAAAWPVAGWMGVGYVLVADVVIWAVARALRKRILRQPRMVETKRVYDLIVRVDEAQPDQLVVLRRLPAGADIAAFSGRRYGDGA